MVVVLSILSRLNLDMKWDLIFGKAFRGHNTVFALLKLQIGNMIITTIMSQLQ